jgi:hypothetical protein
VSRGWGASARLRWAWASGRELIVALDRLGHSGERRIGSDPAQPTQTRALVKLVWNTDR